MTDTNFPTIVYQVPGTHACAGGTYGYRGVEDASALENALSSGWFKTLPEAIAGDHDVDDSKPTREELEAKAVELEIKFDGRTSDKSLAEKIEHVLGTGE